MKFPKGRFMHAETLTTVGQGKPSRSAPRAIFATRTMCQRLLYSTHRRLTSVHLAFVLFCCLGNVFITHLAQELIKR